jgi:hypothetical protein
VRSGAHVDAGHGQQLEVHASLHAMENKKSSRSVLIYKTILGSSNVPLERGLKAICIFGESR